MPCKSYYGHHKLVTHQSSVLSSDSAPARPALYKRATEPGQVIRDHKPQQILEKICLGHPPVIGKIGAAARPPSGIAGAHLLLALPTWCARLLPQLLQLLWLRRRWRPPCESLQRGSENLWASNLSCCVIVVLHRHQVRSDFPPVFQRPGCPPLVHLRLNWPATIAGGR